MDSESSDVERDEHFGRGVLLSSQGEHDAAIKAFSDAIALDADDAEIFQLRAASYLNLKQWGLALADVNRAIGLDPDETEAYRLRAQALLGLCKCDLAVADCDRILQDDPKDGHGYYLRGRANAANSDIDQALRDFDHAIRYAPSHADTYRVRADLYDQLGRFEEAQADRAEAARRDPWSSRHSQ